MVEHLIIVCLAMMLFCSIDLNIILYRMWLCRPIKHHKVTQLPGTPGIYVCKFKQKKK